MLNTGTSIGVMCNVLPAGLLLPKHVPSFTAVLYGRVAPGFPLEQMFDDRPDRHGPSRSGASRRPRSSSTADLYEQTRLERERAFQRHQRPSRTTPGRSPRRPSAELSRR